MQKFFGKNILVTGTSRGLGMKIAERFLLEGATVAGISRTRCSDNLLNKPNYHHYSGDLSNYEQTKKCIDRILEELKDINIAVCNVGSGRSVPSGEERFDEWQRVLGINFFSTTNVIESFVENSFSKLTKIVCISSICGVENVDGAPTTYSVAKSALNSYVKKNSRFLAENGILINAISPGNLLFEGSVWDEKLKTDRIATQEYISKNVPTNILGTPDDIFKMITSLCSDENHFITGQNFVIDGGQTKSF